MWVKSEGSLVRSIPGTTSVPKCCLHLMKQVGCVLVAGSGSSKRYSRNSKGLRGLAFLVSLLVMLLVAIPAPCGEASWLHLSGGGLVRAGFAGSILLRVREYLNDGRSGEDIFKGIALGADLVMIGRPIFIAAAGSEIDGVSFRLNRIKEEFREVMRVTGCKILSEISKDKIIKF